jgi:hypothetical protein
MARTIRRFRFLARTVTTFAITGLCFAAGAQVPSAEPSRPVAQEVTAEVPRARTNDLAPIQRFPSIADMLARGDAARRFESERHGGSGIKIGPPWLALRPPGPAVAGLPAQRKSPGAYIVWSGTPWAHRHVVDKP